LWRFERVEEKQCSKMREAEWFGEVGAGDK